MVFMVYFVAFLHNLPDNSVKNLKHALLEQCLFNGWQLVTPTSVVSRYHLCVLWHSSCHVAVREEAISSNGTFQNESWNMRRQWLRYSIPCAIWLWLACRKLHVSGFTLCNISIHFFSQRVAICRAHPWTSFRTVLAMHTQIFIRHRTVATLQHRPINTRVKIVTEHVIKIAWKLENDFQHSRKRKTYVLVMKIAGGANENRWCRVLWMSSRFSCLIGLLE
jgi:hypothetical protein